MTRASGLALLALIVLVAAASACDPIPDPNFERMKDQSSLHPYQPSPYFANGSAMQTPVAGTVSREFVPEDAAPPQITRALLHRGHNRFDVYCAACHGLRGDGVTPIRQNFELRPPPTLLDEKVRARPPAELFRIVSGGWGLMPSYGQELTVEDRWAVVAYLRALQRSQTSRLEQLPGAIRSEAEAALAAEAKQPPPSEGQR